MKSDVQRRRLETAAIVVGYCMSRLDKAYLRAHGWSNWREAFAKAGRALKVPPASLKNLRDEFDPFHPNSRQGWHKRPLRPNRQRVLAELAEVGDEALLALDDRILARDEDATVEAIDSMAVVTRRPYNVAERLLTGHRAEQFFLENTESILQIPRRAILDMREAARGFDFAVENSPETAIEVKGIKGLRGDISFTDREWTEARFRRQTYIVVVVGNLQKKPLPRVIRDPHSALSAKCCHRSAIVVTWACQVALTA